MIFRGALLFCALVLLLAPVRGQNCRVFGIEYTTTPPVLRELDPLTAAIILSVPVSEAGFTLIGAASLTAHPITHELFAILRRSTNEFVLARVDRNTGVATTIGVLPDRFTSITFNVSHFLVI